MKKFLIGVLIVIGVAALCSTAFGQEVDTRNHGAIVTGILHDGKNPILSTETPGARVTIYGRNGEWNYFVATTDCDNDRGCVSNASGRFWFYTDQNGNVIRPGRVVVSVTFDWPPFGQLYKNVSVSGSFTELTFEYELLSGLNDLGILPVQALVAMKTERSRMYNQAGGLGVPVQITNTAQGRVVVILKTMVSAMGSSGWMTYPIDLGVVNLEAGQITEVSMFIPLTDIGIVNGFGVHGVVEAVDYVNPWRSYGRLYFSVPKY